METDKILNADILDIVFDGKNKEYGAYQLRKTYNRRLITALTVMAAVCLLGFFSSILAKDNGRNNGKLTVKDVELEHIKEQKEKRPEPPPPPPPPKPEPPKVEIAKYTPIKIVKDDDVKPEDEIKDVDKLIDTQIGTTDVEGKKYDGLVAPPVEDKGTGFVDAPKKVEEDYDHMFVKVEKEAKFPGGAEAWKRYLERNLNAQVATDDGAPPGNYTVKVQFIVDKEGNISQVQAIDKPKACPACGPEAEMVIKKGPKWEPAIQNDRKVIYQAVQFITFQVAEE